MYLFRSAWALDAAGVAQEAAVQSDEGKGVVGHCDGLAVDAPVIQS